MPVYRVIQDGLWENNYKKAGDTVITNKKLKHTGGWLELEHDNLKSMETIKDNNSKSLSNENFSGDGILET